MVNHCSLCNDTLLRHFQHSHLFWYCPSCRQEMLGEEAGFTQSQISSAGLSLDVVRHSEISSRLALKVVA